MTNKDLNKWIHLKIVGGRERFTWDYPDYCSSLDLIHPVELHVIACEGGFKYGSSLETVVRNTRGERPRQEHLITATALERAKACKAAWEL